MLYRAALLAVAAFCGTMWTLLIRSELRPQETTWRAVPLEMVLRGLFQQEQDSGLTIREGSAKSGFCRIRPKAAGADGLPQVDIAGDLGGETASAGRHVIWTCTLGLDAAYLPRKINLTVVLRPHDAGSAGQTNLDLTADNLTRQSHYRLVLSGQLQADRDFNLDQGMITDLLSQFGLPEMLTSQLTRGLGARIPPVVSARQAQILLHGERVETYLVNVQDGERTLLKVQISQIGQILHAETFFGWKLTAD